MRQSDLMLEGEGDAWFDRNRAKLGERDLVTRLIEGNKIEPKCVLEVGCANGWRLLKLRDLYGCSVYGVEPSIDACREARVPVAQGTADALPYCDGMFDLVIYGFCLYLTDPQDWFKIAYEGDRVLRPGGHLIVHDFDTFGLYARPYIHREGMLAYHADFSNLWLKHPLYRHVSRNVGTDEDVGVVACMKKMPIESIKVQP